MSGGNGSDFENDGDYLQEPSAKKSKLEDRVEDGTDGVLQLHTGWVQGDATVRHTTYSTDADGPVPVPQSDFEIEINSSTQDGPTSPGHEITLTSTSTVAAMQIEPRILTIDSRLPDATIPTDHSVTVTTDQSGILPSSPDAEQSPPTDVPAHDFSSLIAAAAGRTGLISSVADNLTSGDLTSNQFVLQSQSHSTADGSPSTGPLYVMIPPTSNSADLIHAAMQQSPVGQSTQRSLVPRLSTGAIMEPSDDNRKQKEYMRKQTHNEVERRRRDRINELIKMLAELVPGCQKKDASNGAIVGYVYSKGTVLEKTVEYVRELLSQNDQLSSTAKLAEKSANALQVLQNQITVLEKENAFLRAQMIQLGIDSTSGTLNARSFLAQSLFGAQQMTTPTIPTNAQLLVNLAQTLTNNPLLASLSQQNQPQPQPPAASDTTATPTAVQTQANNTSSLVNNSNGVGSVSPHLMNSLVQTLANLTGSSSNTLAPPVPPTQVHSSTAAVAMTNFLNSLMMAQSAFNTAATATTPSPAPSSDTSTSANLLLSQSSPEKTPVKISTP